MKSANIKSKNCILTRASATNCVKRDEVQAFLHDSFAKYYGAEISHFLPYLIDLREGEELPKAAVGLMPARASELYLERYLESTIEYHLSVVTGRCVDRNGLVEIGNLAAETRGGARQLFQALVVMLYRAQYEWAVFTIGPVLRNTFKRMNIELTDITHANPMRLPQNELALWGGYFNQKPRVMAANVNQAFMAIEQLDAVCDSLPRFPHSAATVCEVA